MTYIHPTAIIYPNVYIGEDVYIGAYCVLGGPPEHKAFFDDPGQGVKIGSNTRIFEFTTVHSGTERKTQVGNNCILMQHSHVAHDCILENNVSLCNAKLGGHAHIMKNAVLGLGAAVHQWQIVGSYCMVGMNSTITKQTMCIPGSKLVGSPAKVIGKNHMALRGVEPYDLEQEVFRFKRLKGIE